MRTFTTVCVVTFLAGCASQPASTSTAVAIPAADAAKMAVLNPAMAPATAVTSEPSTTAVAAKASVPPGYKSVERDGTTFFCTKVASLGTKFKREFCMTQDRVRRSAAAQRGHAAGPAQDHRHLQRRVRSVLPATAGDG